MNRPALFLLAFCFFFILCIGLGCVLLYSNIKKYNETRFLVESGITTKAVVIDLGKKYVELPKYSGYVYQPMLEYSDLENKKVTFKRNTSTPTTSSLYQLGDSVDIIYYKDKPYSERENSFEALYGFLVGSFIGASIFIVVGLWGLIYFWRIMR